MENLTKDKTVSLDSSDDDEYFPVRPVAKKSKELSCSLRVDLSKHAPYIRDGKLRNEELRAKIHTEALKESVCTPDMEQKHALPPYEVGLHAVRKQRQAERDKSKGKNWFNMAAPEMSEEQKRDLQVLQMRHLLDPRAFYKANDLKVLPKFYQMGRVVEHAADFYHSRVPKKQRKQTMVDELLADTNFTKFNKRKYNEALEAQNNHRRVKVPKRLKVNKATPNKKHKKK